MFSTQPNPKHCVDQSLEGLDDRLPGTIVYVPLGSLVIHEEVEEVEHGVSDDPSVDPHHSTIPPVVCQARSHHHYITWAAHTQGVSSQLRTRVQDRANSNLPLYTLFTTSITLEDHMRDRV